MPPLRQTQDRIFHLAGLPKFIHSVFCTSHGCKNRTSSLKSPKRSAGAAKVCCGLAAKWSCDMHAQRKCNLHGYPPFVMVKSTIFPHPASVSSIFPPICPSPCSNHLLPVDGLFIRLLDIETHGPWWAMVAIRGIAWYWQLGNWMIQELYILLILPNL